MKIIKKLCIPLLSLVLVLSCFTVSQMDASAAMSANDHIGPGSNQGGGDHIGPGSNQGGDHFRPPDTRYPASLLNVSCKVRIVASADYNRICGCYLYQDRTVAYQDDGHPYGTSGYCRNCGHSFHDHRTDGGGSSGGGGSYVPSHTHNYSTTWGAWRKISSCRFLI